MNYQQRVKLHSSLRTEKDYSIGSSVFEFYSNYFFTRRFKMVCSLYEHPPPTPLPRRWVSNLH